MQLSIIIPVFNENESLPHLKKELNDVLVRFSDWEVLFIDDGSSDGSSEYLEDICSNEDNYRLIQFYRNYGKSAALSEGFKNAEGDYIITMDADLQDDPKEIPNLIEKLREGWDLVSGWKKIRYDPINKTLPSKKFNFFTRILTGVKIHDFNCGLKAYNKSVIKSIDIEIFLQSLGNVNLKLRKSLSIIGRENSVQQSMEAQGFSMVFLI